MANEAALADIITSIDQIAARIKAVTASEQLTITDQGRTVRKTEYLKELRETLKSLMASKAELSGTRGVGMLWLGTEYEDSGGE